ncbi:glycosyltransferase family 4 protein [Pseudomonadota bacterium]
MQDNPPDVFVPNLVVAAYFAGRWVKAAGIPTIGILHSDDAFYRGIQDEFVFGRKDYRVTALACVSEELERQVTKRQPETTAIRRIPYGVVIPKRKVERNPGRLRLAYVGRFAEEQKRVSDLTRALCHAVRYVPGAEAVLYGDGPDRNAVEDILNNEGMGLPVILAGRVGSDEIQAHLLECDVLVLLSDYEGLPIALLEAMACGVVPVCLRMRSGVSELIEDGVTGLVVDNRNEAFIHAVTRLQNEAGLWGKLSTAARAKVESEFSHEASVNKWANLFRKLGDQSRQKSKIQIPRKYRLPPVNSALSSADPRPHEIPMPLRWYRKGRMFAGRIRRRMLGQTIP